LHTWAVRVDGLVVNADRALGTTLSYRVSKVYGEEGLPKDTITSACEVQQDSRWVLSLRQVSRSRSNSELEGDSNDYVGKRFLAV